MYTLDLDPRGILMGYSTPQDIEKFMAQLGDNPMFVCDMDGNVMEGYSLNEGQSLVLSSTDNPKTQSIPFGTTLKQLDDLVEQGVLKTGVFAEKSMDARLPQDLVDFLNDRIANNSPFNLTFLTSRAADDARRLLVESGVANIDKVTLVADSGATLYISGQKQQVCKLSDHEGAYLNGVESLAENLQSDVNDLIKQHVPDFAGDIPALFVEHKGIATNIHYRAVLSAVGQGENSDLDKAIGAFIKGKLQSYVDAAESPKEEDGKPVFKTLDGPATVEMKVASVNKGHGLAAMMEASFGPENPRLPTAVVVTGDDVAKGEGTGTDYYMMVRSRALGLEKGVPTFNIHTHHAVGNNVNGTEPDPNKSPTRLAAQFPQPPIDITVPTPKALGQVILRAFGSVLSAIEKPAPRAERA